MTDSPIRALREAESWLVSAKQGLIDAEGDDARANVCCAQAIHSIIRANDALSLKFLGHKSTRHDDAAIVFMKIAREGKLPQGADGFKALIANAMRDKSGADYGKKAFSYEDAQIYIEQTEHFIAMVKDTLKI
ncbi:hypothetical protein L0Y65_06950 [Candidatus Micrarchaeota archaeon]|nr:hypothetical protein [Candidatus Micrarchaeota archaeon]